MMKEIHRGSFQFQLISEYWSVGVMPKGGMSFFFNTPIPHHSRAETIKNFWQPLNYLFIGYGSGKSATTSRAGGMGMAPDFLIFFNLCFIGSVGLDDHLTDSSLASILFASAGLGGGWSAGA